MGTEVGKLIRSAQDESARQGSELAEAIGIGESTYSAWKKGTKTPAIDQLPALADALDGDVREFFRAWLIDMSPSTIVRDRLTTEIFGALPKGNEVPTRGARALRTRSEVFEAGKLVTRLLNSAKDEVLKALAELNDIRATDDKGLEIRVDANAGRWTPIVPGSRIQKDLLFVATRPTPFVVERHRFPGYCAALHRQDASQPASCEIWSVAVGAGGLVVETEDGTAQIQTIGPGMCGYYWGSRRHIWVNLDSSPLVVLHCFYPYRSSKFGPDQPGEACEIDTRDVPESTHESLKRAIQATREALRRKVT